GLGGVGEERAVGDVALVPGAIAAQLAQREARHHRTSCTVTVTCGSTSLLSTRVGHRPSNSVAPAPPPRPDPVIPAGGADNVSGTSSRPTYPAVRASSQRHAMRSTHSGGSAVARGTVGPPSASTPHSSTHHSSTSSPAIP